MQILLGTTKGLLFFEKRSTEWQLERVSFPGISVSMLYQPPGTEVIWVGLAIKHWGPKLFYSDDGGKSWQEKSVPKYPSGSLLHDDKPASLKLIWSGVFDFTRNRLWLGTEPGGLFWSDDEAASFHLCQSLWTHPSRPDHWFGGGRNHAGIHSILLHPQDEQQMYIGVSCAGVFFSPDGGEIWEGRNLGLRADYLPDPYAVYGHDPHAMAICHQDPLVLWQQNHCGVFRSADGGNHWLDVTSSTGYGSYGFPLVIDPLNSKRAWIIPAESDEQRIAKDQRLVVCYTNDGGVTWKQCTDGLPQNDCFDLVFRHAFAKKDELMAFGTTNGNFFISQDEGMQWQEISHHLPPIHSVAIKND